MLEPYFSAAIIFNFHSRPELLLHEQLLLHENFVNLHKIACSMFLIINKINCWPLYIHESRKKKQLFLLLFLKILPNAQLHNTQNFIFLLLCFSNNFCYFHKIKKLQ